jgi:hypothetical protein
MRCCKHKSSASVRYTFNPNYRCLFKVLYRQPDEFCACINYHAPWSCVLKNIIKRVDVSWEQARVQSKENALLENNSSNVDVAFAPERFQQIEAMSQNDRIEIKWPKKNQYAVCVSKQ